MMKSQAKQTFVRLAVVALASVIVVAICYLIGSDTFFAALITTLLLFATVFVILFYWVIVLQNLFRHLFDKQKEKFDYFFLLNVLFITATLILYLLFYFRLLGGAFFQLIL